MFSQYSALLDHWVYCLNFIALLRQKLVCIFLYGRDENTFFPMKQIVSEALVPSLPISCPWTEHGQEVAGSAESPPLSWSPRSWMKPEADTWVCNSPSHSVVTSCVHGSPSSSCHLYRTHRTRLTWRFLGFWCGDSQPGTHTWYTHSQASPCSLLVGHGL